MSQAALEVMFETVCSDFTDVTLVSEGTYSVGPTENFTDITLANKDTDDHDDHDDPDDSDDTDDPDAMMEKNRDQNKRTKY